MRRFEFQEGKSSKFWEGGVEESTLVTRWGRIGTEGQSKRKDFPSSYQAKSELEKLIAEKVKKGYQPAKTEAELELEKPPATPAKRNKALEADIAQDPSVDAPWLVYADWLQGEGDPRGELITVQHQLEKKKDKKLSAREAKIFEESGALLIGPLRKWPKTFDGKDRPTLTWRRGFIDSVYVSFNAYAVENKDLELGEVLDEILRHPSAPFVSRITIGELNTGKWDNKYGSSQLYQPAIDAIAKRKPATLRHLVVGEYEHPDETEISWTYIGSLAKIWKACPNLETLKVQGGNIELGKIEAPHLREARFLTGGLPAKAVKSIAAASWPQLERLEIWFGAEEYGAGGSIDAIQPILAAKGLPKLRHLGLKNSEFADDIAGEICASKLVRQLETLDLSMGTMTDAGAQALAKAKLQHLAVLDVSQSYLTKTGINAVKGIAKKVEAKNQKEGDEDDGEIHRYVSVGE